MFLQGWGQCKQARASGEERGSPYEPPSSCMHQLNVFPKGKKRNLKGKGAMDSIHCFLCCVGAESAEHRHSGASAEDDALLPRPSKRVTPSPDLFCISFAFFPPHRWV